MVPVPSVSEILPVERRLPVLDFLSELLRARGSTAILSNSDGTHPHQNHGEAMWMIRYDQEGLPLRINASTFAQTLGVSLRAIL